MIQALPRCNLRTGDAIAGLTVSVVLDETKVGREPHHGGGNVLIFEVRKHGICRYGAIPQHHCCPRRSRSFVDVFQFR